MHQEVTFVYSNGVHKYPRLSAFLFIPQLNHHWVLLVTLWWEPYGTTPRVLDIIRQLTDDLTILIVN